MPGNEISLDASLIKTGRGDETTFLLTEVKRSVVELELVLKADNQPDVAQLPMTIFQDKMLVKTVTLTGMDKEWQTLKMELFPSFIGNFYLKFYFAQGGLKIRSAKVTVTKDMEEAFKRGITELS